MCTIWYRCLGLLILDAMPRGIVVDEDMVALDPSRPLITNDGWEHVVSDLGSTHDYAPSVASLRGRYGDVRAVSA